ncbi:MAG: sulfotransferase [Bacteroidales bacterium]|nr:sulfotransferase [Bacteroidales bacterium]
MLDIVIKDLFNLLFPVQKQLQKKYQRNKYPFLFIVGCPRSGTTILLQWLASLNLFSYPTNVLNRFAYAPYIGAQIQKILFDKKFDFSNEFNDINSSISFSSNLGKSMGALSTNEFQHFFRNYMNNIVPRYLNDDEIKDVDFKGIKEGLSSIEVAFGKPFIVKFFMLQFNLDLAFKYLSNSIFAFIKRDPIYNMQSILFAREKYNNDKNEWLGFMPKEYFELKGMDVYHQIAGQVYYTNKSINDAFVSIPNKNKIKIQYKDFCNNPKKYYHQIKRKYEYFGYEMPEFYAGIDHFTSADKLKLAKEENEKFKQAFDYFQNK